MQRLASLLLLSMCLLTLNAQEQPLPVLSEVLFKKGDWGYHTFRIPALIQTKSGAILVFAEGRRNSSGDTGDIDLVMRRSDDMGRTWSDMDVIWDDGGNVCGNPVPIVDSKTGRIVLVMTWNKGNDVEKDIHDRKSEDTRRVFVMHSDDDGYTWTTPSEITSSTKDPEWTWYATGPCHGIQLQKGPDKGRMIVPCNHGLFRDGKAVGTVSHIIYSDDIGQTWKIGAVASLGNESTVVELKNGDVMLNMRDWKNTAVERTDFERHCAISHDSGESFETPYPRSGLIEPRCNASIVNYTRKGKLTGTLLFSNPDHKTERVNMTVKISRDDGKTWMPVYRLPAKKAAYSDLLVMSDGNVAIFYENGEKHRYDQIEFTVIPAEVFK